MIPRLRSPVRWGTFRDAPRPSMRLESEDTKHEV